jgi:putative nucleotidyltransferase with HDIG domain
MRKVISFIFENYKHFTVTALFFLTALIIFLIIPHQTRFKYEYHKGKPWMYETLYAPFDFPILKDPKELEKEKDSIIKNSPKYFSRQKEVVEKTINLFNNDLALLEINDSLKKIIQEKGISLLQQLYNNAGIISIKDTIHLLKSKIVYVQTDSAIEEYFNYDFYTPEKALQKFFAGINSVFPGIANKLINIKNYFKPNVFLDEKITEEVKNQFLSELSSTKGLIQKGEPIINKGEIITLEKYQILESLHSEFLRTSYNPYLLVGQFLTIALGIIMVFLFLYHFRQEILSDFTKTSFILSLIILFTFLAQKIYQLNSQSIYIVPFTLLPIIIRSFYDTRLALFVHTITILIISYFLPNSFEFMFMQYMAGTTAIFVLVNVRRRVQLFLAAFFVFLTYSLVYFGISIVQTESIREIEFHNFSWFAINAIILLSAYPLIYLFEKLFGFLSDVTLMELADTNHPLLKMLSEKAPGTFQHSLQVANLAEEIVQKIGGNSLLARVGALYHDIGKIELPQYFIENQYHMPNPHKDLQIDKSVEIIAGHVRYGIQLARKYKLPKAIIDFIESHHGTSIMQYFYRTYKNEHPNEKIDIEMFKYKGTPPSSKETAVVMIVDAVEAASRSLKDFNEETIKNMIENIINQKLVEKQFDNAPITLKEITLAKEILKKRLINIYHSRISYPAT